MCKMQIWNVDWKLYIQHDIFKQYVYETQRQLENPFVFERVENTVSAVSASYLKTVNVVGF